MKIYTFILVLGCVLLSSCASNTTLPRKCEIRQRMINFFPESFGTMAHCDSIEQLLISMNDSLNKTDACDDTLDFSVACNRIGSAMILGSQSKWQCEKQLTINELSTFVVDTCKQISPPKNLDSF